MKMKTMKIIITAIAILSIGVSGIAAAQSEDGHFVVLVGAPAAGKSVNSDWMSKAYGIPWINVGEALRAEVEKATKKPRYSASTQHKRGTASAKRTKDMNAALEKLKNGDLVSNDSLNAFVASQVLSSEASKGFVLDSYPVTPEQASFLDSILDARDIEGLQVIYLDVSDEVAVERLKAQGKAKFKRSFAQERIDAFRSLIGPVTYYYGDSVQTIDANQDPSAVTSAIAAALEK